MDVSHKDAPPESATQTACRKWWQAAQPHVKRAWGIAKNGSFFAVESELLHRAWLTAQGKEPEMLLWTHNETGMTARSALHDDGSSFFYEFSKVDKWWLNETPKELVIGPVRERFSTAAKAKEWAERNEASVRASINT